MADSPTVRKTLVHLIQATRIVIRCLTSGRDSQEPSQRALLLLVDILDLLYRIKDQSGNDIWITGEKKWIVQQQETRIQELCEILAWFNSTTKSMELYFQPGGVGVCYFRKHLLEKTFLPSLEQYKTVFLLWMQPDSCERSRMNRDIKDHLKRCRDLEPASVQFNLEFEEDALGFTSRLASEHFITLADLCHRRYRGSCKWIFEDCQYKQWVQGSFRTLYCVGPPGAGKTYLSSVIIDSLQRTFTSPDVATVFIFCQDEKEKEQTSIDLLRNILAQLVYRKRSLSYATSALYYSESLQKGRESSKAYQNAIRAEVNRFSKVFFVVDGLDMFSDKDRILGRLQKLPGHAQLLVTLRDLAQVGNGDSPTVHVRASDEDLESYACSSIESDPDLLRIFQEEKGSLDYGLQCEVVHSVVEKCHGVFLLANIHLELLSRYNNRNVLRRALHYLPQSLNEAYGEAMKQIVSLNPCAARHIYWTLYALRPLSVSELKYATQTAESEEKKQESMSFEQSLQIETAGLLTIDPMTGTVRFAHKTAKEYLKGAAARVFLPNAQKDIAETCLTAITPDEVIDDCYIGEKATTSDNKSKGFLGYAAMYWGYHAREVAEGEPAIQVLIGTFLNKLLWRRPPPKEDTMAKEMPTELGLGKYPDDWSAMHILAFFGIMGKSKRLLEQGTNLNMNDNSLKVTPLHCAVSRGNDKMVDFLLENGVDGNAVSKDGNTALHMATQNGQRKVMKLLLSQPVNSQIPNSQGARSLQLAVGTATDEATVPSLVKNRAGVNSQDFRTGDTALHLAVKWRRPRIILFLLEKGAAMNMTNANGITPLQLAAQLDNCEAISLLLQRGAQVDARSLASLTALQIAAQKKHWIAFDLLLIGGADINAWTTEGDTLLHEHARESFSSISIAAKLLDQGMNIEARSSQGYTPLQCAVISRNKKMAMFLLSRGANVDVLTPKGETLLHIMTPLSNDCLEISKAILDQGLDVNAVSSQGWTALHRTVCTGTGALDLESDKTREFIELLLDYGADINAHTVSAIAETPLHLAIRANISRPSLVSLLICLGANVNAMNNEGKTPLHLAGERGRESIFRILLGAGADLSLEIPECNPTQATDTPGDGSASAGSTAFDLARKNPFSILWFDDEGMLRPAPEKKRRDSIGTVIEDMDSEDSEDEMAGSTLVGSEKQFVMV